MDTSVGEVMKPGDEEDDETREGGGRSNEAHWLLAPGRGIVRSLCCRVFDREGGRGE